MGISGRRIDAPGPKGLTCFKIFQVSLNHIAISWGYPVLVTVVRPYIAAATANLITPW